MIWADTAAIEDITFDKRSSQPGFSLLTFINSRTVREFSDCD